MGRRWWRRTGHSAEGLQWGERKDVRGSICQPLSRVPTGFYLQLPAYWLLLNIPPACPQQWTDPTCSSGSLLFICVHKQLTTLLLKRYLWIDRSKMLRQRKDKCYLLLTVTFTSTGGMIGREKIKGLGQKPVPVPLCPPQIPYGQVRDWSVASSAKGKVCCYCCCCCCCCYYYYYHHHHHHHIAQLSINLKTN